MIVAQYAALSLIFTGVGLTTMCVATPAWVREDCSNNHYLSIVSVNFF